MRRSSVALLALSAGLTASAALRRLVVRRRAAAVRVPAPVAAPVVPAENAVVLPFARRTTAAPAVETPAGSPAAPPRCGDNGGRTKAGAPCAARGTSGGRCHHHRIAA